MSRHKWTDNVGNNQYGLIVKCANCGYLKEMVKGIPTYFRDDTLIDRIAPVCDKRILNGFIEQEPIPRVTPPLNRTTQ